MNDIQSSVMAVLEKLRHGNQDERRRQEARIARLKEEGTKLLQAFYCNAVRLELLKSEQNRIAQETAEAEQLLAAVELHARDVEETLRLALALASDCERMYRIAAGQLRRQFNQAFFERIMVDDGEVVDTHMAEPFTKLFGPDPL